MEPAPPIFKLPFRHQDHFGGDDFKVTHTPNNLIQMNEYYPFGMQTANSCLPAGAFILTYEALAQEVAKAGTRENTTGNNFLANGGTELNTTSSLYDLDFRNGACPALPFSILTVRK